MPYAVMNPQDGQPPLPNRYVGSPSEALPGEVVIPDAEFRRDWVWDAATQKLRPRTDAELLARAKAEKKSELEGAAANDMANVMPVYRALLLLARNSADPRFAALRAVDDKVSLKHAAVDAATTPQAVAVVKWEA